MEILKGRTASKGRVEGIVKNVDKGDRVDEGDILVASMTTPELVPAMRRAAGIVTDLGGVTCHAAIVSREFGIPCIVGTGNATSVLTESQRVEVDARERQGVVNIQSS